MSFNPFDETNKKVFECVLSALAFFCGNKSGKNSNILLVEGSTDKKFFENRLADGVEIYSFEELSSYDSFLELNKYNYKPNFKRSIINIIQRTKDNMTEFCKNPEDAKNYNFYGIVDLDTDNFRDFDTYHNLFITDEHDLETTIIANDNNVISKLDGNYTEEDLNKALYTAHQYEFIRNEIKNIVDEKNISLSFGSLENKNGEINFSDFFTDRKINYKEYLHSIKAKMDAANVLDSNNPVLKDTSIRKILEILDKKKLKNFNDACEWIKKEELFDFHDIPDIWKKVNGHIVLQMLRDIKPGKYYQGRYYKSMSYDLGARCNDRIKSTRFYSDMVKLGILV